MCLLVSDNAISCPQKTKSCVYRQSNSCIFLHEITKILFYAHFTININQSINHLFVKASKMTVTKVSVQDQQGSESAYSDPKTKY